MEYTVISTKLGQVKGKIVQIENGKKVKVFRNIPFAKPPTGKRRFMPPEPSEPWSGVLDCTKPGNLPVYMTALEEPMKKLFPALSGQENAPEIHDEDCLHASVYVPNNNNDAKMAVMVWLYGGGFQMGSESTYDGTVLAGFNDVVVVVPNYRVGILGFFSLGKDSLCPGNAGVLDQQQALRWVQENIEKFGGDKNNVTIFGESAGGASVHLNLSSPTAEGLFHKAISHSGQQQLLAPYQGHEHAMGLKNALRKCLKINCEKDEDILKELQKMSADKLLEASMSLFGEKIIFGPVVDGKVIPRPSIELMKEKVFAKVPYIIGCNNTEGDGILSMFPPEGNFIKGLSQEQAQSAIMFPQVTDEGLKLLKKKYLREEDGATKYSKFLGRVLCDSAFVSTALDSAIAHSEAGADVYCYLASFRLKLHHDDAYGNIQKKADWCECDHGDDVIMTFGAPFSPYKFTQHAKFSKEEENLSRAFMTYLTNFAKTGNPNKGNPVELSWPKYTPGGRHLVVNNPVTTTENFGTDVRKFWTEKMAPHFKYQ